MRRGRQNRKACCKRYDRCNLVRATAAALACYREERKNHVSRHVSCTISAFCASSILRNHPLSVSPLFSQFIENIFPRYTFKPTSADSNNSCHYPPYDS